jgi:DNA-binding SARP family transcriptional activator
MRSSTRGNQPGGWNEEGLHLSVQVLGSLVVRRGEHELTAKELGGPRQRQLLEILLLALGTPVSKHRLVDLLWGEHAPPGALGTVESYVCVLRRHLQPGHPRQGALKTTNGGYLLDPAMVTVDLHRFDRLLEKAQSCSGRRAYLLLDAALEIAGAPLLGNELDTEWAQSQRAFHTGRVLEARLLAAEAALEAGMLAEAVVQARTVLAQEALAERAWTVLVLALEATGQAVEGLQAYDRCRRVLDQELGSAPGAALQQAHQRMLHATAATNDDLAQAVSALLVLHGTPHAPSSATDPWPGTPDPLTPQEAATVLRTFLGRTLSMAC